MEHRIPGCDHHKQYWNHSSQQLDPGLDLPRQPANYKPMEWRADTNWSFSHSDKPELQRQHPGWRQLQCDGLHSEWRSRDPGFVLGERSPLSIIGSFHACSGLSGRPDCPAASAPFGRLIQKTETWTSHGRPRWSLISWAQIQRT